MPDVVQHHLADNDLRGAAADDGRLTNGQFREINQSVWARQVARQSELRAFYQEAYQLQLDLAEVQAELAVLEQQEAAAVAAEQEQAAAVAAAQQKVTPADSTEFSFAVVTRLVQDWVPSWAWVL